MRRTCGATRSTRRAADRHRPAGHDRVGVEQRHRQVAGVVGPEPEPLGQHPPGERDLAVGAAHRLGFAAGARREDQHEQVVGIGGRRTIDRRAAVRGEFGGPLRRFDVDAVDVAGRCRASPSVSTSWQSAWAMSRASAAPRRVGFSPTGTMPGSAGGHQHRGEERRVAEQHTDVRRPAGSSRARSAAASVGAVANVVAPADERTGPRRARRDRRRRRAAPAAR